MVRHIRKIIQHLTRSQSRTVLAIFCFALIIRCLLASFIAITDGGSLFQDDYAYLELATQKSQSDLALPSYETLAKCELIDGKTYCIRLPSADEGFTREHSDSTAKYLVGCREFKGETYCQRGGWGAQDEYVWNSAKSFLFPIALLFRLFGPQPILAQLLVGLSGAIAVAGVVFLISQTTSNRTAFLFGLLLSLYPSHVLWSSLVLKDSFIYMALVLIAVLLERWDIGKLKRSRNWLNIGILLIVTLFLCYLRITALIIACIACFIATAWKSTHSRILRTVATLLILLLVPLLSPGGGGPQSATGVTWRSLAGIRLLTDGMSELDGRRNFNAQGADTAVVATSGLLVIPMDLQCATRTDEDGMTLVPNPCEESEPAIQQSRSALKALEASLVAQEASLAAQKAVKLAAQEASLAAAEEASKAAAEEASVAAEEASLAAAEEASVAAQEASVAAQEASVAAQEASVAAREASLAAQTTPEVTRNNRILEELRHLPVGLRVMLFDPMPNHLDRSTALRYPFMEHLLWYPILILALIGLVRNRIPTSALTYSLLVLLGSAVMWGAVEGNFGTAYRHRAEFAWVPILFASTGFHHLLEMRTKGRPIPPHHLT
jgi:hypothetical protein